MKWGKVGQNLPVIEWWRRRVAKCNHCLSQYDRERTRRNQQTQSPNFKETEPGCKQDPNWRRWRNSECCSIGKFELGRQKCIFWQKNQVHSRDHLLDSLFAPRIVPGLHTYASDSKCYDSADKDNYNRDGGKNR